MAIKRLIPNVSRSTVFDISDHNALLLLTLENKKIECLYIESIADIFADKFDRFQDITCIKFIGGKQVLEKLKEVNSNWKNFDREVLINSPIQAVFYSDTGKVRFEEKKTELQNLSKKEPSKKQKKKVLIIDDSKTIQKLLSRIISKSENLEVMGIAGKPSEAREIIEKETPDVITLDIHMPEMNGVEFLKTYLKNKNIPTAMVSSVSMHEGPLVIDALSNGALTYIQKPSLDKVEDIGKEIVEKLIAISKKKVTSCTEKRKVSTKFDSTRGLIAIGSSTGGTNALQDILTTLPSEIPPIVIVQHIPAVFSNALANRLNDLCPFKVKEAENGEEIIKNTAYIAPGGKQFSLKKRDGKLIAVINDDPPVNRFKPSVDYLFKTIPELKIKNIVGAILTGMGKDGAKGLLALKECGAKTMAQDEESSVVFGMPKEALKIGAAQKAVSLENISSELVIQFNKKKNKQNAA